MGCGRSCEHRLPQCAVADPCDVRDVATASILSKSKGGLITLPKCDPKCFTRFVGFLTGGETTLEDFCERSPSLRKCESILQKNGTTEEPQSVRQRSHGLNQCAISALGLDHVHVIALGVFSPADPSAHDNAILPVLSIPLVLTPLLSPASPSSQHLILERNVTPAASDAGHLTGSPARCATIFMRIYCTEHLSKLHPPPGPTFLLSSESPLRQQLTFELNVRPTALDVEGLGDSPKTDTLQFAPICNESLYSGRPKYIGKLGVPDRTFCPGAGSLAGVLERCSRYPDESPCTDADRPQCRIACICDMRTLGSATSSSALTLLQPLASPSSQRLTLDLDVTQAAFGEGGIGTPPPAVALRFSPICDDALLRTLPLRATLVCRIKYFPFVGRITSH